MLNVVNNCLKPMNTFSYGPFHSLINYLTWKSKIEIFMIYSRFTVMNDNEWKWAKMNDNECPNVQNFRLWMTGVVI